MTEQNFVREQGLPVSLNWCCHFPEESTDAFHRTAKNDVGIGLPTFLIQDPSVAWSQPCSFDLFAVAGGVVDDGI